MSSTALINHPDMTEYEMTYRTAKGSSIIDFPEDYTVIDLETTGLCSRCDEIIELAAVRVHKGEIVDSYQQLVKPESGIDEFIASLTGITNEMVVDAPSVQCALPQFLSFVGEDIVVGHNVTFDVHFVYDNSARWIGAPFRNNYVNTLRLARKILDLPRYRLCDLCEFFNVTTESAHRALADCHMTHHVLKCLKESLEASGKSLADVFFFPAEKRKRKWFQCLDARSISCQVEESEIDKENPLYGKRVVFTGELERFKRADAMQLVVNLGGINQNGVTKTTDYLVLGNNDYCTTIKDGKSSKQKKAEQYMLEGTGIAIMDEKTFYDMVEDGE